MLRLIYGILFFCSTLWAQAQVRLEGKLIYAVIDSARQIEMCFAPDTLGYVANVGLSQYHHPAIVRFTPSARFMYLAQSHKNIKITPKKRHKLGAIAFFFITLRQKKQSFLK